jgi:hypothetical protein
MDLSGMGEQSPTTPSPTPGAAQAAPPTATKTSLRRSSDAPSPTSMQKKRGNQPR